MNSRLSDKNEFKFAIVELWPAAVVMGLLKFVVLLDRPIYYSGQTISGRLLVQVDKPMSMKAIYLKYTGEATVSWTETHQRDRVTTNSDGSTSRTSESYTETYSSKENYLSLQQLVFGNDNGNSELPEGEHVFIFNCQLPMNMPSSFEGSDGRIRYSVKATIDRPWKFNHVTKHPMTVMSVVDLNQNAFASSPVAERTSKTFWGHSKPLLMSVNLPVRGFVPGQIIPIKVLLNNESGVQVKSINVSLKQKVTFHATNKSKEQKTEIFKNEFPVPKGLGCEEVPVHIKLPVVPPSYLQFCKIIDLDYHLSVTAIVKAWYHKNLKTSTEVIVGNVPLMSYQRPIPVHQLHSDPVDQENPLNSRASGHQPPAYGFVVPPGTMYEDLPPPSYEQCMKMERSGKGNPQKDPRGDGDVTEFLPLYPVYKFGNAKS